MSNTKDILLDLIKKLYTTASQKYNLRFNKYRDNYYLKGSDENFLGNLGNKYNSNSIFNRYGNFGSRYSQQSIFSRYGQYGSRYSLLSPYNKYATTPPLIYDENNRFVGYLSANKYLNNSIDPNSFIVKAAYDLGYSDRIEDLLREY